MEMISRRTVSWTGGIVLFAACVIALCFASLQAWAALLFGDTLDKCLLRVHDSGIDDSAASVDINADALSWWPLGTVCRIRDLHGNLLAAVPATDWTLTLTGYTAALVAIGLVVVGIMLRARAIRAMTADRRRNS